jgi:hypothetical protein
VLYFQPIYILIVSVPIVIPSLAVVSNRRLALVVIVCG